MNKRPNIILFMPETMRADAVFGDTEKRAQTPNIDCLVKDGVSFTNCFTQSPFCTPSRCSMFSGLYPHTSGHRSLCHLLHNHERNLFRDLKEAGYTTICFGKNDLLAQDSISESFDSVKLLVQPEQPTYPPVPWGPDHKYYRAFYIGRREGENRHDSDWACIESALKFLDKKHEKPFCLFLPLLFAHPPYTVEEPFFSLHERSKIALPIPAKLDGKRKGLQLMYRTQRLDELTEDDLREIRAVYYGMISRLDHQLGLLVEKLRERNLYNSTAIFVFSDHGDYAGDYGLVEKWNFGFEDALLHTPLVMRIPGYNPAGVRRSFVEMVDLYSTVLDVAGVGAKHYHFSRSLLPLLSDSIKDHHRDAVFAEAGWATDEKQCFTPLQMMKGSYYEKRGNAVHNNPDTCARAAMIRTSKYKYAYCPGDHDELYDLTNDPSELCNLNHSSEMKMIKEGLKERILEWMLRTCDTVPLQHDKRNW